MAQYHDGTRRELQMEKLDEVFRLGFITEDEYLRRRLELLRLSPTEFSEEEPKSGSKLEALEGPPVPTPLPPVLTPTIPPCQPEHRQEVVPMNVERRSRNVVTPTWRFVEDEYEDECSEADDNEEEDEDTDDEAYARRHTPYERYEVATKMLHMTVGELREWLADLGLPVSGVKASLVERLALHLVPGDPVFKRPVVMSPAHV